jgi:hypothetical protein
VLKEDHGGLVNCGKGGKVAGVGAGCAENQGEFVAEAVFAPWSVRCYNLLVRESRFRLEARETYVPDRKRNIILHDGTAIRIYPQGRREKS